MKTVYLGGAIRKHPDPYTWRAIAKEKLEKEGFIVLDPLEGSFVGNRDVAFVKRDLEMIKKADILLVEMSCPDVPYIGTSMEICEARHMGKQIVIWGKAHQDSIWVQAYADQIFSSLEEALNCVINKNTPEEIIKQKLQGDWYHKLGYREQASIITNGVRSIVADKNNPGVYTVNACFQIAYKSPLYPDGTVIG